MRRKPMGVRRYVQSGGAFCIYCESQDIEGGEVTIEDGLAFQEITCAACHATWTDVYHLKMYVYPRPGDAPPEKEAHGQDHSG
jgi:hypothetical protein